MANKPVVLGMGGQPSTTKAIGTKIKAATINDAVDRASSFTGGHWRVAIEPQA